MQGAEVNRFSRRTGRRRPLERIVGCGGLLFALCPIALAQPPLGPPAGIIESSVEPAPSQKPAPGALVVELPAARLPRRPGLGTPQATADAELVAERYVEDRIDASNTLDLEVGRPALLRFRQAPFRDQVADTEVVEVLSVTEREISITGKKVGTTVLNFWFEDPEKPGRPEVLSYLVRVLDDPEETRRYENLLQKLEREINRAFPNSSVKLAYVGKQVVLRGQAKDIQDATSIQRIVAQSLPRQVDLDAPFDLQNSFIDGISAGELGDVGGSAALVSGQNATGANPGRINARIVNLLEIAGVQQVMLKVTVAEVNRSALRTIGADLRIGGESGTRFFSLGQLANLGVAGAAGSTLLVDRGDFDLAITALKQMNLARSLAEPNLVTLNGQMASFFVGGSFPVPEISGFTAAGLQGVRFEPFGVSLSFTPMVTDNDRIRLTLQAVVSTRDEAATAEVGNTEVPGLNSRNFNTTVELREGQTIAIAGLIQTSLGSESRRSPFLGDIPFLGRLFSNDTTSYDEQELIVLVTPYHVGAIDACIPKPALPGSDYYEPDDIAFFLRGSITGNRPHDYRTPVRTDCEKMKAFRRCEQQYIIGQPGHSNGRLCPAPGLEVLP
jgi:pilus assembly protein CpaC